MLLQTAVAHESFLQFLGENIQVFLQANMDVSSGLSSAIVVVIFVVVALVTAVVLKLQNSSIQKETR